ncbi:MAG: hypothetical protein ACI8UD_003438 [Planctomycetota bacterium]|jgi:hypothetical protein
MARFALLVLGVLLATAVWLWLLMDLAPIAPAMAFGRAEHRGLETHRATVATGITVAAPEQQQAAQLEPGGERTTVVVSAKRYMIRGAVTRGGVGQPGREVLCSSGWGKEAERTVSGRDGVFTFEVEPGAYELYAPHMQGTTQRQPAYKLFAPSPRQRLAAAKVSCVVKDGDVALAIQLSMRSFVVTVRNSKTFEPVASATVAWQPPLLELDELRLNTDQSGRARFSDVTLGNSTLAVSARAFIGAEKGVEVHADGPDQVVDFLLTPACAVDVVMVNEQRQAVAVSPAQIIMLKVAKQPALLKAGDPAGDPVYPSNRKQFLSKQRPLATPFDHLSAGPYRLYLDSDHYGLVDDEPTVRFAPCIAKGQHLIDVRLGEVQRFEVPVEQRSFANLRTVDLRGDLLNGALRVTFQGSDGSWRRVMPAPWQRGDRHGDSHFVGYLKPGTYSLVFRKGERVWREQLVVAELLINRTMRLPW